MEKKRAMSAIAPTLDEILLEQIRQHTGRRVQDLSVKLVEGEIVLFGSARSFHVKQLATHGARQVLPLAPLRNAIEVK